MVMTLEEIKVKLFYLKKNSIFINAFLQHVEDKNLVSAHFAALFGEYDLAQELFLKCGCPLEALNVRRMKLFLNLYIVIFRCDVIVCNLNQQ